MTPPEYSTALLEQLVVNNTTETLSGYMYVSTPRQTSRLDLTQYGGAFSIFWDWATGTQTVVTTVHGKVRWLSSSGLEKKKPTYDSAAIRRTA